MRKNLALCMIAAAVAGMISCAGGASAAPSSRSLKEYLGAGRDPSLLGAMNKVKMDAVRKAVIDMIGEDGERSNREILNDAIYASRNPNAFVESVKTTRKDRMEGDYIVEGAVMVRLDAVSATLKARGLLGGESVAEENKAQEAAATPAGSSLAPDLGSPPPEPAPSPDEQRIIRDYVEHMTYMVYVSEGSDLDAFFAKAAIGIANEYLASNTMEAIDIDQIEKLKKDQQKLYESETGESISITQWIARKLNADVYIEIDGLVSGEVSGAKYYGQANVTLKVYEASTGRLLGSVPWNSPKTLSTASSESAIINALQTSVYKAMPVAISQAKTYMVKALARGIKYELLVQKTPDSRLMSTFGRRLREKVKDARIVSQTDQETKFDVYLIGSIDDLADAVYNVSEKVPGLENMRQILLRGKSLVFNSGM